jgi:hypothetical protein
MMMSTHNIENRVRGKFVLTHLELISYVHIGDPLSFSGISIIIHK